MITNKDKTDEPFSLKFWFKLWLKLLIGLALSLVVILTALILMVNISGGTRRSRECENVEKPWRKLSCSIAVTYDSYVSYVRSPPSDWEMIGHFEKNRADFERLVTIYREDPTLQTQWTAALPTPEIMEIMNRINVTDMRGDQRVWMSPDPYSPETERKIKELGMIDKSHRGDPEARKLSGVFLSYGHAQVTRWTPSQNADGDVNREGKISKGYYYIPLPPKIEAGLLKLPQDNEAVYSSLDSYPLSLMPGDCVYRQIDPQWFLQLCQ